jgi:hypothetical protein
MQVDRRSHTIAGQPDPKSQAHINQASGILKDALAAMIQKFPTAAPVRQLQAAVAAYNCGPSWCGIAGRRRCHHNRTRLFERRLGAGPLLRHGMDRRGNGCAVDLFALQTTATARAGSLA